MRLAKMVELM